jgi:TatD DNase family protein
MIDTHTHLATTVFDEDRPAVLERARRAGVTPLIAIGAAEGLASNHAAVALAAGESDIYATLGLHPHDAAQYSQDLAQELCALFIPKHRVVGWGEIGLDFHYMHADQATQEKAFIAQLEIAHALGLPVVIHTREAEADTLRILKSHRAKIHDVVIHCFTGDEFFACELDALGAYLGLGGVLTFRSAEPIRRAVAGYPLDRLLLETDCPYLAPVPYRGKRNEPAYATLVAAELARILNLPIEEIDRKTSANARRFFRLPRPLPLPGAV